MLKVSNTAKSGATMLAIVLTGCATSNVKFAQPVTAGSLDPYRTLAIAVVNDIGDQCPPGVPENMQAAAIKQMQKKYPSEFETVRPEPLGEQDELLTEVHIVKYKKGSRFARAMLIGLGPSKVSTDVKLLDSASNDLLASGRLDLVWALGGAVGASVGIEDLVNDAGSTIANAIVQQKRATKKTKK